MQLFLANGWTPCSANDLCNVPAEASPYKALFRRVNAIAEQHKQAPLRCRCAPRPEPCAGHPVANIPDTPHLILGGGTGFFSKTVGYPYLKDDYAAALFKSRCSCSMHPCRHSYRVGPSH